MVKMSSVALPALAIDRWWWLLLSVRRRCRDPCRTDTPAWPPRTWMTGRRRTRTAWRQNRGRLGRRGWTSDSSPAAPRGCPWRQSCRSDGHRSSARQDACCLYDTIVKLREMMGNAELTCDGGDADVLARVAVDDGAAAVRALGVVDVGPGAGRGVEDAPPAPPTAGRTPQTTRNKPCPN